MSGKDNNFFYRIEWSAWLTIVGIVVLFSSAVIVTLIAPRHIDPTWVQPTSSYQVQMYEVADPHIYFSSRSSRSSELQAVYHLKKDYSLLAFQESKTVRFVAPPQLKKYVSLFGDDTLKLTSRLMLLRKPKPAPVGSHFDAVKEADIIVTATGCKNVVVERHFRSMKDKAVVCNI